MLMEVRVLNKNKKNTLGREEYAHGYDLNPDDFDVIDRNNESKKHNQNENRDKPDNNPSRLNQ